MGRERNMTSNAFYSSKRGFGVIKLNYNNYKYSVVDISSYNCGINNFPSLVSSNIPDEVTRLKYNLNVNNLNSFLIQEKKY